MARSRAVADETAKESQGDANSSHLETLDSRVSEIGLKFDQLIALMTEREVESRRVATERDARLDKLIDMFAAQQVRNSEKAPVTGASPVTDRSPPESPAVDRPPFTPIGTDTPRASFKSALEKGNRRTPTDSGQVDKENSPIAGNSGNSGRNNLPPELIVAGGTQGNSGLGNPARNGQQGKGVVAPMCGLKEEIKSMVRMWNPKTLDVAFDVAICQERNLAAWFSIGLIDTGQSGSVLVPPDQNKDQTKTLLHPVSSGD
ncbi:OLC1v1000722C1 [Oldenlandia corymbosa var. corymbosa]|uniref:OLC1v1000722C1 n=1 Tax=Oldenlandia corymbosa var. corymbosa TaxID=529605 RepID=A0AAV1D723_OLDCO|nr:OLC1v1000722C1 [Oldenlandia corymbosa var. corymbosa]